MIEAEGGGLEPGPSHAVGGDPKKALRPARMRELARRVDGWFWGECQAGLRGGVFAAIDLAVPVTQGGTGGIEVADPGHCADPPAPGTGIYAYMRCYVGKAVGGQCRKQVYRLYCEMGLQVRHKRPRRRVQEKLRKARITPVRFQNDCWSMDCMAAQTLDGQRLRVLR